MDTGRNKTTAKLEAQDGQAAPVMPRRRIRLYDLLPSAGFDWDFYDDGQTVLNLRREFVTRIEDAFRGTYGDVDPVTFDDEMAQVILRATDMGDLWILDTDPIEFWRAVQFSFAGDGTFATHRRMTARTLHAFVAYALDARNANTDNRPNAWGNLARALDAINNEFAHDRDAETADAYYERPKSAYLAGLGEDDNDDEGESESEKEDETESDDESDGIEETDDDDDMGEYVESEDGNGNHDAEGNEDEELGGAMDGVIFTVVLRAGTLDACLTIFLGNDHLDN